MLLLIWKWQQAKLELWKHSNTSHVTINPSAGIFILAGHHIQIHLMLLLIVKPIQLSHHMDSIQIHLMLLLIQVAVYDKRPLFGIQIHLMLLLISAPRTRRRFSSLIQIHLMLLLIRIMRT